MTAIPEQNPYFGVLHIFVLSSFAVTQPMLDQLSRKKIFLQDQGIGGAALVTIVLILLITIPAILSAIALAARRFGVTAGRRTLAAIVFILLLLLILPIAKLVEFWDGILPLPLALAGAAAGTFAYLRFFWARFLATAASPAIVAFPVVFFFFSPIARYLSMPQQLPDPVQIVTPIPVVLVVFDEFCGMQLCDERQEIDADRYPNFATLARNATWYRNATAVHLRTDKAVPAILAGIYPRQRDEATAADYPNNLFAILEPSDDMELTVFEPYSRLFPPGADLVELPPAGFTRQLRILAETLAPLYLHIVTPRNLPISLPTVPFEWFRVQRPQNVEPDKQTGIFRYGWNRDRDRQFAHFLRLIQPSDPPRLYFSHLVAPHFPWCFLPSGHQYLPDDASQEFPYGASGQWSEVWSSDELVAIHAYQRHLLQLGYVDRLLGQLMERLHEVDLFDRCMLIVTADHGASFWPGRSRRAPVDATLPDILSIPLFIKYPGQSSGSISDENVESIDILPTVLDVLGMRVPFTLDGASLRDPSLPRRPRKRFYRDDDILDLDAAFTRKSETVERMIELFGTGADPERFYRIGPNAEWIGRRIEGMEVAAAAEFETKLNRTDPTMHDTTELSPVYLEGHIQPKPSPKAPVQLAISVNGTIRAVTRTYQEERIRDFWTAMIPENAFRSGENELLVWAVSRIGDRVVLRPVTVH